MTGCTRATLPFPTLFAVLDGLLHGGAGTRQADAEARKRRQAERILDEYGNTLLRFAYSYLHNRSDAEDILQETLIRCLRSAPDFESREHEKAWLLRVTANLCKNRLAYERLRRTDPLEENLPASDREDLSFVWEAVRSLPGTYREVIHLYYYEGYSTAQIAKLLGRRESTVRSDLHRGRQKLREILREAYDFD